MTGTIESNGLDGASVVLKYLAVGALTFQAVHLVEHVAQLGYWIAHPAAAPWLTPWAAEGRDALAVGGQPALGNELLHLIGNLIFLGGLVALAVYLSKRGETTSAVLRLALILQGVHVVEHVLLTATSALFGKAIGVSTFLGLIDGPVTSSYRVWFHFLMNLVATWYAGRALVAIHSAGFLTGARPAARAELRSRSGV